VGLQRARSSDPTFQLQAASIFTGGVSLTSIFVRVRSVHSFGRDANTETNKLQD